VRRVADHFQLPVDSGWLTDIARSPVLTRYSKSPDFEYSAQLRGQLLRESRQSNAAQIAAGLRWLENLAGSQPAVARKLHMSPSSDVANLTTLGKRLLVGEGVPVSVDKGIATLRDAAARGMAKAATLLSVCAAWGLGQPRNIDSALDHLTRAAQLAWAARMSRARAAGARLRGGPGDSAPQGRSGVLAFGTRGPRPVRETAHRRHRAVRQRGGMSVAHRPRGRRRVCSERRSIGQLDRASRRDAHEPRDVVHDLQRRRRPQPDPRPHRGGCGTPVSHFEIAKLLHYSPGEQFALHADFIEAKTPELARELAARGQRSATFLIYLNDGYEGGATQFPRLSWQYRGGAATRCCSATSMRTARPTTTPFMRACRRRRARSGCCRSGSARGPWDPDS
jgi:hypothetical protein